MIFTKHLLKNKKNPVNDFSASQMYKMIIVSSKKWIHVIDTLPQEVQFFLFSKKS